MREVDVHIISKKIKEMFIAMNYELGEDLKLAITKAMEKEEQDLPKSIFCDLLENARLAGQNRIPMCQDTGMAVVFMEIGQDIHFISGYIEDAVNQGVREAYEDGFLRKSVVSHPLERKNTGDNTPAVIHYEIVKGDKVKITTTAKGFGSENMSRIKMLNPSDGEEGVLDFIIETVKLAGPNPCPPVVVGVGIGGTMEKAALIAKKALTRDIGVPSKDQKAREIEERSLEAINKLNIGPQGFGGKTSAFSVNIDVFPTHIAGLPIAVNINCHASRHMEAII
ncbi:MAG: fumarate hydratase [Eubacteriales bacterium]